MQHLDFSSILSSLIGINVALLGVIVTLITIVPALMGLAQSKDSSYLSSEVTRRQLKRGISDLSKSIWLFGLNTILSIIALFWDNCILLGCVGGMSLIGVIIVVRISYTIAVASIS